MKLINKWVLSVDFEHEIDFFINMFHKLTDSDKWGIIVFQFLKEIVN